MTKLKEIRPPKAKRIPYKTQVHGVSWCDDYFWLRERDNAEVLEYIRAENAYTKGIMEPTQELQKDLYQEMVARIKETDETVPAKKGNYFYYSRTEKGKQYSIYCRKHQSLEAVEEIILDCNKLAKGRKYFSLGVFEISPKHNYLAYSTDVTGAEEHTIKIKDLQTGKLLPESIENTGSSLEWACDNQTLFYATLDAAKRPFKLFRHVLESKPSEDLEVYHEKDERFFLNLSKSKDEQYIFLELESKASTEVHYLRSSDSDGLFQIIEPRQEKHEYSLEHYEGKFLVLTNNQAQNFKICETPVSLPEKKNWKTLIPHKKDVKVDDMDVFKDHLAIYVRDRGMTEVDVRDWKTNKTHRISFEEAVFSVEGGDNPEYESDRLRLRYSSLVSPNTVLDFVLKTQEREIKKVQEVKGYDSSLYQSERIFATSHDGIEVPISLVYKKGSQQNGKNPLLLYGYGSYGISIDPVFSSNRLSLLDRGFVFAIAHIRGGGEMGRSWYENGKMLKKHNTFKDFIACAEKVIQEKYTSPEYLFVSGGSAGGLLMGAVVNERPELFRGVVMHVPFVDVVNTMLDESIPLTVTEYDEWGNPNEKEYFDYIRSYSPYDNIKTMHYPAILVASGLNDPRVQYWEPTKWMAKLRAMKTDRNLLLLKMNMGAGHGGASGRYDYLKEIAFDYAFSLFVLEGKHV